MSLRLWLVPMLSLRPILFVIGILLSLLGLFMLAPALADAVSGSENWAAFLAGAAITIVSGGGLMAANFERPEALTIQQGFLLTTLSWVAMVAFAAVPFSLQPIGLSYTDAFFEAMSGLTTTGSTVLTDLDTSSVGFLLWRALLQWIGGIGIVVMAIAVLPMLQVGGMQLFRMESSDNSEKILPRATQVIGAITLLYLALTVACAAGYRMAGMNWFDASAHAMTTIATGGFSTRNDSVGHFQSAWIEANAIAFMILGSLPFVLYLQATRGRLAPLWRDSQVRWFLATLVFFIALLWLYHAFKGELEPVTALRQTSFSVVSIMTGTGYATTDYGAWGGFSIATFFMIMFVGGCAGSTSCGIKIFRFQVLFGTLIVQLRRAVHPHGVFRWRYNGQPVTEQIAAAVISFIFLFIFIFGAVAVALAFMGLEPTTAMSAAGTALANVGPGLGDTIGPKGTFADLPASAKWLLAWVMLLGRLELFTVLVLFTPSLWRA